MPGRNIKYSGSTRIVLYAAKTTRFEMQDPASYSIFFKSTPGGRKKRLYIICTSFNLKFELHCVQVSLRIIQKNSFCCGCVSSMKFHVVFLNATLQSYWFYQKMSIFSIFLPVQLTYSRLTIHSLCTGSVCRATGAADQTQPTKFN